MAKSIKGITIEIGGNTTKLVDSLKAVNKQVKENQTDLKELDKLLKLDPGNSDLLVQKQKALTDAIDATKSKIEQEKTALEQLKNAPQTDLVVQQQDALTREIIKTEQNLKTLTDEYKNFGSVAAQQLIAAGDKMQAVGDKISGVGMAIAPVSAAVAGIGTAAVMVGAEFDAQMSKVKAISGAAGEDFDSLRDKAREMGAKTQFSATEAAQAMEYMSMAGWKTNQMLDGLEGVMNLAAASGESLAKTSDIVTDALTAFGLKAEDSGHFADVLASASSNSNTNVSLLGESFKYVASTAGAFKFSAEDVTLALGLMANAGIKGSQSGESLKNALVNLIKPTKKQAEAMQALGYITTETVNKIDDKKVEKAQKAVETATLGVSKAQEKYNAALAKYSSTSPQVAIAQNNVKKATLDLNTAQSQYNAAIQKYGANSAQAIKAHNAVEKATLSLSTAQAKYNDVASKYSTDNPQIIAAHNNLERAKQKLAASEAELAKQQEGVSAAIMGQNTLMTNADGSTKSLREVMDTLRATLGQVSVSLTDAQGNARDFDDIVNELANSENTLTQAQQLQYAATIFGKQNMSGMLAVLTATDEDYKKLAESIDNCDGKSKEMSETMQDNLQGDLTKLKSALQELAIQISDALMPTIRSIVDHVKSWVEWLQGLDDGTKTTIVVIGAFVAALAPVLIVIGQLVISVGAITKAIGTFSAFMSASAIPAIGGFLAAWWPVIAIIAGVVAAIAGLILIFKNWGEICEWFGELWDSIWGVIKDSFTGIFMFISDTIGLIASVITNVFTGIKDFFVSIWDNVSDTCSSAWDKISSGIGETMTLIGGVISKAWTGIKENLAPILAKISDGIKDHWTTAKNIVSDAVEATRSFVSEKWDAISSYVSGVCETVTETIGEKWESAKERVSTTVEALKTAVGDKWDAMKERVMPIMESIGDGILAKWEAVKEKTASIYDIIASSVSNAWENIKESVSSKISGMWESVKSKFTGIWETIKGIVQRIRDCFSFEWKLPKIKLPHFKIKGSFSLSPPSVPHLSIEWYKKAMDDAYILNSPTIFGAIGGKLLGGGEAGSEAVVGTDKLASIVRDAMASVIGTGGTTVIPVYIGQERIEEIVVRANQSINYRSGGR